MIKDRVLVKDPEKDYLNLNPYAFPAEIILFGYTFMLAFDHDVTLNINLNPMVYYFMTSKLDLKDLKEALKVSNEEIGDFAQIIS